MKKLFLILPILLALALPVQAQSFVIAKTASSSDGNGFDTSGSTIDTTNATLGVAIVAGDGGGTYTFTDSKGNTWTPVTQQADETTKANTYYTTGTVTVGSGHYFTVSGSSTYASFCVAWYSATTNTKTDDKGGFQATGDPTVAAPAITAATAGDLVVATEGTSTSDVATIDNGGSGAVYTIRAHAENGATFRGCAIADKNITGSTTPTWSMANTGHVGVFNLTFAASGGGGGDTPTTQRIGTTGVGR